MRWLSALVVVLVMLLDSARLPSAAGDAPDPLTEARARLVESTRDYRLTLDRLLALEEAEVTRTRQEADKRRALLEQGIVSRREVEESERSEATALRRLQETRRRLAETDIVLAETLAAIELARLAPAPSGEAVTTPLAVGGTGNVDVTVSVVDRLDGLFLQRFGRPLPVSARGQTPVHDRLRLDHHHAVDVAVHPDSEEGRVLVEYLRFHRIPFLAFRGFIPGASTGAHVHIGRASGRVIPAGSAGR